MEILDIIKLVEDSNKFKVWKEEHQDYFLAHVFKMIDEENQGIWQVGYCRKENNYISSFQLDGDRVEILEDSKPFKKPGTEVNELEPEKVSVDYKEALDKAQKVKEENHKPEITMKKFFILQNIDGVNLYNITFFTNSFKSLNIRVSAEDGKIISDNLTSFFHFDK